MCGLVGQVLKAANGALGMDADAFEQLLYIDALRGDDSTGLASLFNDGEIEILKEATTADIFRNSKEFESWRTRYIFNGKAVIGHNRKKTSGAIKDETAHPYLLYDRYAFTHNGTLTNHTWLKNNLHEILQMGVAEYNEPKYDVDSEVLGTMICPFGEDIEKLGEQLSKVDGAYACVWLDQKAERIYLIRNKERPLYIALTACGYIYASEPSFIYAAASRNRIKVEEMTEVPVDTLLTIDCTGSALTMTKQEVTVVKKAKPTTTTQTWSKNGGQKTGTTIDASDAALRGAASKQAAKRFRKAFLGGTVWFEVDDYQTRDKSIVSPSTVVDYILTGSNEAIEPTHEIVFYLRNANEEEIIENYIGHFLKGHVDDVVWDDKNKIIIILVSNVRNADNETPEETSSTKQSTTTSVALH